MGIRRILLILIALGCGVALLLAAYLQRDPLEIDKHELERIPEVPVAVDHASAVLLLDDAAIRLAAERRSWKAFDFSWAWLGDLEARFGRTTFLDTRAADTVIPAGATVAVLSASAKDIPSTTVEKWLRWAGEGRQLIVEMPGPDLSRALGFEFDAPVTASRLDSLATSFAIWPRDAQPRTPVHASRLPARSTPADARPLLWLDGAAAVWSLSWQEGHVVVLGLEFARWMTALRQGVPQEDFRVVRTRGSGGREQYYQPNDFMADPDRPFAWVPRADLILRAVFEADLDATPVLPRWSPLPPGSRGVTLFTIDEENFGDRATFHGDESVRKGAGTTYFIVPQRITSTGAARMIEQGADVQLHWNRGFWERQIRTFGVGPFRPVMREMNLVEQRDALASRLPEGAPPVDLNRNHGLMWDESWTRTFRILAAADFRFDSTYGPDEDLFGWVFDTARPYRPLDESGRPFDLLELPFPYQDDENYAIEWQRRLLRDSANEVHGVLAPIFHSVTMKWNPAAFRMRGWLELYDFSAEVDHPVWSVSRYLDFLNARLASELVLESVGPEGWTARATVVDDTLRVDLPASIGWRFQLDGQRIEADDITRGAWAGVVLAPGEYRLTARRDGSRP